MGGRGTFAAGNPVPYVYEVDTSFFSEGKYNGIKVLKGKDGTGKHGLPESSHSSIAYLKMNPDGTFNTMRIYDEKHRLRVEIAYHSEQSIGKGQQRVLHYHTYGKEFSSGQSTEFSRTTHILHKNSKLYKKYKKFFRGVNI
ncbi:hypothetical protein [Butyrivibrio hungatei]|uniref:Uncharacterized protein n=1 Tax=Butyrivibrio hungatei TaxID=185008 RepID=A0A1D9NYI0_9FIRM|nr:hypothetical protein [Butyrivibrio hungatei]AOZ95330.1 hypothetical protein bhn_I0296 [Butyrivibrio hungatei]